MEVPISDDVLTFLIILLGLVSYYDFTKLSFPILYHAFAWQLFRNEEKYSGYWALASGGSHHVMDLFFNYYPEQGKSVNKWECIKSICASLISVALTCKILSVINKWPELKSFNHRNDISR